MMTPPTPLTLPEEFDPAAFAIARVTENGVFHESRAASGLAAKLVANGHPQDLALAERVLEVVLNAQERHPNDPHYGNFLWMIEDDVVFDLNAVEFNLEHLIPMMIRYRDRLKPETQSRVLEAIRLGLNEIKKLDVLVAYSNIAVLDILNSCLGGELLGDRTIAERGYRKLVAWMGLTDQHGTFFEYNSPTYTSVVVRALKILADHVQDADTRIRVRTIAARVGISVALHIHKTTGRWAGPHSRAYQPTVLCEMQPEKELLYNWLHEKYLPEWIEALLRHTPTTFETLETANSDRELGLTTYHSPSFALGTSVKEAGGQSNSVIIHYDRPGQPRPGVFYTRYLTNEKWLGDFYHATDRTRSRNLIEEGRFYSVQQGSSALCLYTLPDHLGPIHAAKAALIWTGRAAVDEIWIGERRVETLPASVSPGEVIVVGSGAAWMAVLPLSHTDLGRDAPVRLVEKEGDLVLEIYNYLGPEKPFWELGWPGAFYQGKPRCGFYLETAERSDYTKGGDFARTVAHGEDKDTVQPPFTYTGQDERIWHVSYTREDRNLSLDVDLMTWKLKQRCIGGQQAGWPMLESPMARQTCSGEVRVGEAILSGPPQPAWLFACPEEDLYVAGYHGTHPVPLTLKVPGGQVSVEMGTGTIVWDQGAVSVEAVGLKSPPQVTQGIAKP